jgi:hypothetical protein
MSSRLVDRFPVGSAVDVLFRAGSDRQMWVAARVIAHAHPGVWVQVEAGVEGAGGSRWFVTNGGRIRTRVSPAS